MRRLTSNRALVVFFLVALLAGFALLTAAPASASHRPADRACQGPAQPHNPNCEGDELVPPVCDGPAGEHNPLCPDGPPPSEPGCSTPGGANNPNCPQEEEPCDVGIITQFLVFLSRDLACALHNLTGL